MPQIDRKKMKKIIDAHCLQNKLILIGKPDKKGTIYFLKAAHDMGVTVHVMDRNHMDYEALDGAIVKIDPPYHDTDCIDDVQGIGAEYTEFLEGLLACKNTRFLNHPKAIAEVFNKIRCKEKLHAANIPCTQMFSGDPKDISSLQRLMKDNKSQSIFIKPVFGSGAAGAMAYRFEEKTGRQALYTASSIIKNTLVNTKKIKVHREPTAIYKILTKSLEQPMVVERWTPKDSILGQTYDIRVLYLFGKIHYMVARLSKSPITNLHLNNRALEIEKIGLSPETMEQIETICHNAMDLFPGLAYAGIDVLIEKTTKKPYIIEINGQGDLIHKDVYGENIIFKRQIEGMMKC